MKDMSKEKIVRFGLGSVFIFFAGLLLSSCKTPSDIVIYFDSNGGTTIENVTIAEGNGFQLPEDPVKEGYSFVGWYFDDSFFLIPVNVETILENTLDTKITVYAKWEVNQYTLTFDSNGGSEILPMNVDYNSTIVPPEDPIKPGYTFDGWYSDSALTIPYNFSNMPATNISLYAKWNLGEYQISYQTAIDKHHGRLTMLLDPEDSIKQLSMGFRHTMLLTTRGKVFSWGTNQYGQCGVENESNIYWPLDITHRFNLESDDYIIQVISAYDYSTALSANGRVFAWGRNDYGQLGDGTLTHRFIPTDITHQFELYENEQIIEIQSNTSYSAALTSYHRLFVWGRNQYGQLGIGSVSSSSEPVDITQNFQLSSDEYISQIQLTFSIGLVLTSSNRIFTWGTSEVGALGNGVISDYAYTPTDITANFGFSDYDTPQSIYANASNGVVLTTEGQLFMWGSNFYKQINNEGTVNIALPTNITPLFELEGEEKIIDMEVGAGYASVLTSLGRILIWGRNDYGQLGDGTKIDNPNHVDLTSAFNLGEEETITQMMFDHYRSSIVTSNNQIYMWGYNFIFGAGGFDDTTIPVEIPCEILSEIQQTDYIYGTEFVPYTPTMEGYTFDGWYIDISLTEQFNPNIPIVEDITLYGKWIINTYVLIYNWYPGVSETTSIDFDDILHKPKDPTRTGYSFDGWYIEESLTNLYVFGDAPNRDLTLFAKWVANQYTITFDSKGGTPVESITQGFLTELPSFEEPTKTGYVFMGWYRHRNNWDYLFSQTTMPYEDVLLEAKWEEIVYLITYELDGGINGSNPINYTIVTNSTTLENPTKDGYLFSGWYDNPSFTGDAITEIPSGSIGDVVLYALWELIP